MISNVKGVNKLTDKKWTSYSTWKRICRVANKEINCRDYGYSALDEGGSCKRDAEIKPRLTNARIGIAACNNCFLT